MGYCDQTTMSCFHNSQRATILLAIVGWPKPQRMTLILAHRPLGGSAAGEWSRGDGGGAESGVLVDHAPSPRRWCWPAESRCWPEVICRDIRRCSQLIHDLEKAARTARNSGGRKRPMRSAHAPSGGFFASKMTRHQHTLHRKLHEDETSSDSSNNIPAFVAGGRAA